MKATWFIHTATLVVVGALVGACSSHESVAPSAGKTADLGQVLAEMSLPLLQQVDSSVSSGSVVSLSALVPSSCAYAAESQSFVCPPTTRGGLTITRSFTLLDASGAPQSQFDPSTTAAVRTNTRVVGRLTTGLVTTTIDDVRELTLSGLRSGTHVLNGSSTTIVVDSSSTGGLPALKSTVTTTITDLVLPSPTAENAWPTSGTVAVDTLVELGSRRVLPATHTVITFNGTSEAAVAITTGGSTSQCIVNLARPLSFSCTS